jgi:hypothetical protein
MPTPRRHPKRDFIFRERFNLAEFAAKTRKKTGHAWFEGDALKVHPRAFGTSQPIEHPHFIGKTGSRGFTDIYWYENRRVRKKGNVHQRAKTP